ncbi:YSC84-related protein [Halomonas sp. 1390]|uniref:YSC84-related protein n=1 Tax=Halomonas sp. B23F22_3 TaxID=3459516 RepID=UPI00373E0A43
MNGETYGYCNAAAASYGLQAGVQSFGYAMFFMTDSALQYLKKSSGWEVGISHSIVIIDEGMASSMTTTNPKSNIDVVIYVQKGLMADIGLQVSRVPQIDPDK